MKPPEQLTRKKRKARVRNQISRKARRVNKRRNK